MASGTLWQNKQIADTPVLLATATYEYERVGTQLRIKIDTSNHCTSRGAYWDWRWAFKVSVNGTEIASNVQIKPRTHLDIIGTTVYNASTGWTTVDIGTASQVTISVTYFDTQAGHVDRTRRIIYSGSFTLAGIPALPTVTLSTSYAYPNMTHNSLRVNYSISGSCDYVRFFVDNKQYGDFRSSPVNITGLSSNTNHTIYAKGYGNGGFGNNSNTLSFRTFLTPVGVGSASFDLTENQTNEGNPFGCTAHCNSNNPGNTQAYEYAICDGNKSPVKGPWTSNSSSYNITGLDEEKTYYLRVRVQTKGSGAWSDYYYILLQTPSAQARGYLKIGNNYSKGKIYYKRNGSWVKVKKAYIKINGVWKLTRNN